MVDWNRLVKAVLCTTMLLGICIALACLPIKVLVVLAVVAFFLWFVFAIYKALGDNSEKDNRWQKW